MYELEIFAFASVALLVAISPGQTNLFVLAQGLTGDKRRIFSAVIGIFVGNAVWIAMCAVGVAALIRDSELAFEVLRVCGGAYLIYLGIQIWREGGNATIPNQHPSPTRLNIVFVRGMLSSLSNPKGFIFYLSFLPQFVSSPSSYMLEIILWGSAYLSIFIPVTVVYGILGVRLLRSLGRPSILLWVRRVVGAGLVASGISLLRFRDT